MYSQSKGKIPVMAADAEMLKLLKLRHRILSIRGNTLRLISVVEMRQRSGTAAATMGQLVESPAGGTA